MFRTLHSRLLLFFMVVSLGGIVFVSGAIHLGLQDSFRQYLDLKREDQVIHVVRIMEDEYAQKGAITNENVLMLIHQQAMNESLYYQVFDVNDRMITDSTSLMGMMEHMMSGNGMMSGGGSSPSELKFFSKDYPLQVDGTQIGKLTVFYPQGYAVETDFKFLGQINKYIIAAALTMIIIATLLSLLFSKKLTIGLNQLRDAANELKRNNLAVRIPANQPQTEEMQELAATFNELAESLSQQEKLRKQFTGDLAHELRTPLATLRSQLEAFQDKVWEPTPARLKQSHHELMRLVRLVDDLEKLLAAENPQIRLNKELLEAGALLTTLGDHFLPAFREKGVELVVKNSDKTLELSVDKDRFIQIMTNLVNNALKYTLPGGQVTLSASEESFKGKSMVKLEVKDTGLGISKEDLPHIFERFYRGDKSRDRKTGGVGIGLPIVNALVQAHKGELKISSELDLGTRVMVFFPKA